LKARQGWRAGVLLTVFAAFSVVVPSCTLTRVTYDACTKNEQCFESFGRGHICAASGLCEPIAKFARCNETFPQDFLTRPEVYPNGILFGSMVTRTRKTQLPREAAMKLAIKDANQLPPNVVPRKFGLVSCDISQDPKYDALDESGAAIEVAKYLRDKAGVRAVLGPMASDPTLAVWEAMKDRDLLIMSPSSTSNALTQIDTKTATDDTPGLLWRTAGPDAIQGAAMASYLAEQTPAVTRAVVLHTTGAYGDGLAESFEASFRSKGGTTERLPFATTAQRDSQLVAAGAKAPAWLVIIGQVEDAVACLNGTINNTQFSAVKFLFSDTAGNVEFLDKTKSAAAAYPRVFGARAALPVGEVFTLFQTSFTADNGGLDPRSETYVANAYDATWMLMYGTSWALGRQVDLTGTNIAKGLRRISNTGPTLGVKPADYEKIRAELEQDRRVNLVGASGALDFDPVTEETTTRIDIWNVTNSTITTVKTF
jgi:ABC-type branched-subunit amino acid transport system substrate-binding protein